MAEQGVVVQRKLWFGGYDLTSDMQAIGLSTGVERLDNTVMGNTARASIGGLPTTALESEGLWDGGDTGVDAVLETAIGVASTPVTVGAETGAGGERAYFFNAMVGDYIPGASVGELFRFTVSAQGGGGTLLIPGFLLNNSTETSTGNGTAYQIGTVGASAQLYAVLHVVTVSGTNPTLDVVVASDDEEAFGGSPETQITFTQATGIGSEYATPVAGAITDDWWRAQWTIGGTDTPTFEFVVAIGIL